MKQLILTIWTKIFPKKEKGEPYHPFDEYQRQFREYYFGNCEACDDIGALADWVILFNDFVSKKKPQTIAGSGFCRNLVSNHKH